MEAFDVVPCQSSIVIGFSSSVSFLSVTIMTNDLLSDGFKDSSFLFNANKTAIVVRL